ncbi:MAG: hypothetical protein HS111_23250 [Kofleriaceae bacterium]|nr:hypothetical protein [Kofleriaceae bacterium]MCL4227692.1 hypothetical protein [Myxococcales bacterium]
MRTLARRGSLGLCALALVACGGEPDAGPDGGAPDAAVDVDAPLPDAPPPDAAPDAAVPPLPGFGAISGQCGVIDAAVLAADQAVWFQGELTFATRFVDPDDRAALTPGGLEVLLDDNAGGSSRYSEVFAFEWLARCELAALLKTETEIVYDVAGKKADLLVELGGARVGVSVTRAVTFPFGSPFTPAAATTLLQGKLDDLALATTQVTAADAWSEQLLATLAYDAQHAQVLMDAWAALDPTTRRETILVVAVTSGDDLFIYTDQ